MAGFGFGFGSYRNNATRLIALLQGSTIAKLAPAQLWNGTAGSGFTAVPVDPARTTAKPVMRLMVPPNQYYSDELLVGVMAGASDKGSLYNNLGLKQVIIHFEGNSAAIKSPSFQSFADANGNYRTYFGWWAIIRNDGRHGHAQVYFEAVPTDAAMQSRVIGPYQFSPQAAQHDAYLTVAASGSGDFQTIGAALDHCRIKAFGNPLVRVIEPGDYDIADSGQPYQGHGYCTITADVPNVRIAKPSYTSDAAAALRSRYAGLCFRGLNVALDMRFISEIYSEAGASRLHWLDGCAVINSAGPGALWRGVTRSNSWLVRDGGWFTECYVESCGDAFVQAKLVRGTTEIGGRGDLYAGAPAVIGNASTGHRNDLALGSDIPALTLRYTGAAASATVTLTGANSASTRTITVKIAGSADRTFVLDKSEAAHLADTNYTLQNIVNWLNAIPDITATLLDTTSGRAGIWLALAGQRGASFGPSDIKSAALTLVTHIDAPCNWWRDGGLAENIVVWGNQATNLVANDFNLDSTTPKHDVLIAGNALHNDKSSLASATMASRFDGDQSHVLIAHNTLSTQGILLRSNSTYAAAGYNLVANNSVKSIAWGGTPGTTSIVNNHIHAGETVPASASGSTNVVGTTVGGDDTTLYFDDRSGDFRAVGLLASNLAPSVLAIHRDGGPIASVDVKGADKVVSGGAVTSPPVVKSATVNGDSLIVTFDMNLDGGSVPPPGDFSVLVAGSAAPLASVAITGAELSLTLTNAVKFGEVVSVTYTPGGIALRSVDFENAAAFTGQAVSNITAASPPLVQSATIDGTSLVLGFDDMLDAASVPAGGDFAVTIAGAPVSVMAAAINAANLTLTLATAAVFGRSVTVSYTPGANPLRNSDGENAAPFSGQDVTNTTAASPPLLQSATADRNTIEIVFDDVLDAASVPAGSDFAVTVAGASFAVTMVAISSSKLSLTLASTIISGRSVSIAYVRGLNPLRNADGEELPPFAGQSADNITAASPPIVQSATVNGNPLVISFDDALDPASVPAGGDFAVTVAGASVAVTGVAINSTNLSLTLASTVMFGQSVSVGYTPGTNRLRNTSGENAAGFAGQAVTNSTPAAVPVLQRAAVDGATLALTYDLVLDGASVPSTGDFLVNVGGSPRTVGVVAVLNNEVHLTLSPALTGGENVTISYAPGGNPIRSADLVKAAPLVGHAVINNTTTVATATSVSQYGMTWTFDKAYPVGRYANGDWWVNGGGAPVGIVAISPASARVDGTFSDGTPYSGRWINGAELNPGNRSYTGGSRSANSGMPVSGGNTTVPQGWDGLDSTLGAVGGGGTTGGGSTAGILNYGHAQNCDPGATGSVLWTTEGSIVKCISIPGPSIVGRPVLADMAVLTVVTSVPAAGAMRPGPSSASKTSTYNAHDIDLSVFQNLAKPPSAPSAAVAAGYVARMFETSRADAINSRNIHAANNHQEYGRQIADDVHTTALCLNMDFTSGEKLPMAVGLYQLAIDVAERAAEGAIVRDGGGGNQWKKAPVVIARAMTRSATDGTPIADYAGNTDVWAEDRSIFKVTSADVIQVRYTADGRQRDPFKTWMIGATEWGESHILFPQNDGTNWNARYRATHGNGLLSGVLAVRLTAGAEAIWNRPETFNYFLETQWWWDVVKNYTVLFGSPTEAPTQITMEMCNRYRLGLGAPSIAAVAVNGDQLWITHSRALKDDGTANPDAARYTVLVNGSPRAVTVQGVFRQNVGLQLPSPVSSNDVVTIAYTEGPNPVTSVEGGTLASTVSPVAANNLTPSVGGINAGYPVVHFTQANPDSLASLGALELDSQTQPTGSLWLPHIRIAAAPAALTSIFGPSSGSKTLDLQLRTDRALNLVLRNTSGVVAAQIRSAVLATNTDYGVLYTWDVSQSTHGAGATVWFYDWASATWTSAKQIVPAWVPSTGVNWTNPLNWRLGGSGPYFDGDFGGLYLNCRERLDAGGGTAQRDKLVTMSGGSLQIGTLGDGITGSVPQFFIMGDAAQYNGPAGINRGSGFRFFLSSGGVYDLSGAEWR